jgi:hypothetical protein
MSCELHNGCIYLLDDVSDLDLDSALSVDHVELRYYDNITKLSSAGVFVFGIENGPYKGMTLNLTQTNVDKLKYISGRNVMKIIQKLEDLYTIYES